MFALACGAVALSLVARRERANVGLSQVFFPANMGVSSCFLFLIFFFFCVRMSSAEAFCVRMRRSALRIHICHVCLVTSLPAPCHGRAADLPPLNGLLGMHRFARLWLGIGAGAFSRQQCHVRVQVKLESSTAHAAALEEQVQEFQAARLHLKRSSLRDASMPHPNGSRWATKLPSNTRHCSKVSSGVSVV